MAAVDRSSPMPVYFQIALDVRRRIAAGEWSPGERIAPELQLVREYAVSRVTIRQALAELVKDDLLERHRGSGTYVREQQHPLIYDLNLTVGMMATRLREGRWPFDKISFQAEEVDLHFAAAAVKVCHHNEAAAAVQAAQH